MKRLLSKTGEHLFGLKKIDVKSVFGPVQFDEYSIVYVKEGSGIYHADFGTFPFKGPILLFSTPLQVVYIEDFQGSNGFELLQFHSDFYCIEYHKAEVNCNGLLFNNVYLEPCVRLNEQDVTDFEIILHQIEQALNDQSPSSIILQAFLQLFLAKSSSIKLTNISKDAVVKEKDELMERFRQLLDEKYLDFHKPSDYAAMLHVSLQNLTRRCSRYYKKSPSQLIIERLILEAKKQLHLTRQSVKEIAYNLNFQDEYYFSRVFKKFVKVSPQKFRQQAGISIMADLSRKTGV